MNAHDPMRTCEDARAVLGDYLEGALNEAAQRRLAAHLTGCPDCREALAAERKLFALLAGMEKSAAPAGFSLRVMTALYPAPAAWRHVRGPDAKPSVGSRISLAGALLLLLLIMGHWFSAGPASPSGPERLRESAATALLEGGRELSGTMQAVERARDLVGQFTQPTLDKIQRVLRTQEVLFGALPAQWRLLIVLGGAAPLVFGFTYYRLRIKGAMSNVLVLARLR